MADSDTSLEALRKLRVVDLKERLHDVGLTTSGLKADLVQRLNEYYTQAPGGLATGQVDPQAQMFEQQQMMLEQQRQQEEQQRMLFEQQQRQQEEQQRMMLEQQQRQQEEQQRMMLEQQQGQQEEQQRMMLEQQQRQQEEQQRMMLEQQQRQQEEQQRMMLEQQQRQQEEQQRMMLEQQQRQQEEQQRMMMHQEEQKRMAEMQRQQEEQQRMIQQQQEQQRMMDQQRQQEEHQRAMEQQRLLEEQRQRDEQQMIMEQQRLLEQQRQQEQQRMMEQQRLQDEQRQQEEKRRHEEEQQRLMEQQQRAIMEQQKETLARQQAAMLEDEKRRQEQEAIMQKAHQQQQMLEAAKQQMAQEQQRMAMEKQQQQRMAEQQREEAQLMQQQQLALMEKQREERERSQHHRGEQPKIPSLLSQDVGMSGPPQMEHHRGPPPVEHNRPPSLMSIETAPPLMRHQEDDEVKDVKLPQALEQVLAFKGVRAQQLGINPDEIEKEIQQSSEPVEETAPIEIKYEEDEEEDEVAKTKTVKETKNKKRKKKKKRAKQRQMLDKPEETAEVTEETEPDVEIEYVQEQLNLLPGDPYYHTFSKIFDAFKISEPEKVKEKSDEKEDSTKAEEVKPRDRSQEDEADDSDDEPEPEEDKPRLSKKKLKKLNRLSVAELKQLVSRPDVVEMHDVTAQDPKLLVHLKATRNSVPVPRHWCFKRKFLQGKRGIEKAPFELPDYIKATGIMEMREALQEKEDQKTLKSKMRERVRPKMGKIDIDYQKLHDAFFRWQSKPKMTIHGDLYYEGKEFETRLKEKKPGNLTDDLRTALGMPLGQNADKVPPPWLIAMQRYGPPPSYPSLKIPGLNGGIPEGCSFGYHAGGWGKPPVDENGKPLYGDVFGTQGAEFQAPEKEETIDKSLWGELESESESESESEAESEEDDADKSGLITPGDAGLVTPSGLTSVPAGMETPDMIELRKRRIEDAMDQGGDTPALYQVLPEKKSTVGGAMMGSAHVYDVNPAAGKRPVDRLQSEGIDIDLNPEELDLDSAAMQAKYEQTLREQQSQLEKEDLSDMVAEHAAKQQKKRKKQQQQDGGKAKKYKEFKF